jgi:hypothetical protein
MQIRDRLKLDKPESMFEKMLEKELLSIWNELSGVINGGLKFSDNFNCEQVVVADTGTADTEFKVAHTLKRVPSGYLMISRNKAGQIYKGSTAWSDTFVYLKADTANMNITLLLI